MDSRTSFINYSAAILVAFFIAAGLVFSTGAAAAQTLSGTVHIIDNATGGDCGTVGTWNDTTNTCTLNGDLGAAGFDGIHIDSDNVTLNGGGHSLTGNDTASTRGVYLNGRNGARVTNLSVADFDMGIQINAGGSNVIDSSTITGNAGSGVSLATTVGNFIDGNTISGNGTGIAPLNSDYNEIWRNTIANNTGYGINFSGSSGSGVYHNNFTGNATQISSSGGTGNYFSLSAPDGGNYFDSFDTAGEGCSDGDSDGICDAAYTFTGGQDTRPFVNEDGWVGYRIRDDATGGDCGAIGNWNDTTNTCTLSGNVNVTRLDGIYIDSDNVTLDGGGYTLSGSGATLSDGVYMSRRSGVEVRNLGVASFASGIRLSNSSGNVITGNTLPGTGIYIIYSNGNTISDNTLPGNAHITFRYSSNNTISGNNITGNNTGMNIYLKDECNNNTLTGNTLTNGGGSAIYIPNSDGNTISSNVIGGEISLRNSINHTISNNTGTGAGGSGFYVYLHGSLNNSVSNNVISGNAGSGVYLQTSSGSNTISGNTISGNAGEGVLDSSDGGNTISGNTISGNLCGVCLSGTLGSQVYHNNFTGNTTQVSGSASNSFNLAAPTGGNYFDNFDTLGEGCINVNGDGFCDNPYVFTSTQDNLPWTSANGWDAVPSDTTPPVTTDNAPAGWQNSDVTVTLSCDDGIGGSGCNNNYYRVDSGSGFGSWQTGASALISTEGTNTIEYYSTDAAGNSESPAKSTSMLLDKTGPAAGAIYMVGESWDWTESTTPAIAFNIYDSLSGVNGSTYSAYVSQSPQQPLSCTSSVISGGFHVECPTTGAGLTEGDFTAGIEVMDNIGNAGGGTRLFHIDTTEPVIDNLQPSGEVSSSMVSLSAGLDDGAGSGIDGSSVKVFLNGSSEPISGCVVNSNSVACPPVYTGVGTHTFMVEAKDNVGNLASNNTGSFERTQLNFYYAWYEYGNSNTALYLFDPQADPVYSPEQAWISGPGNWERSRTRTTVSDRNDDGKTEINAFYDYGNNTAGLFVFDPVNADGYEPTRKWTSCAGCWVFSNFKVVTAADQIGEGVDRLMVLYDYGNDNTGLFIFNPEEGTDNRVWLSGAGNWDWNRSRVLTAADFDGDATTEVAVIYDYGNDNTGIFIFDPDLWGNPGYSPERVWLSGPGNLDFARAKVTVADQDDDGRGELVLYYNYGNAVTGLFVFNPAQWSTPAYTPERVWLSSPWGWDWHRTSVLSGADQDGDGITELAVIYDYDSTVALFHFDPDAGYEPASKWVSNPGDFMGHLIRPI